MNKSEKQSSGSRTHYYDDTKDTDILSIQIRVSLSLYEFQKIRLWFNRFENSFFNLEKNSCQL
ncbi:hypothetical protein DERF_004312 [Dermatophagoides farinae]|uniref:Uncharacterized protein n=1 Tax=Dermatophagoides farinae TaxID=6954 RepID=A0A922I169_DERFA|nr:hypothetical protein DERF_004312 [Dermatophagoides farinae]